MNASDLADSWILESISMLLYASFSLFSVVRPRIAFLTDSKN